MGLFSKKPDPNQLPDHEEKLMCLGSILIAKNHNYPRASKLVIDDSNRSDYIHGLSDMWGITDTVSAKETISWLINEGHRSKYNPIFLQLIDKKSELYDEETAIEYGLGCQEMVNAKKNFYSREEYEKTKKIDAWDYERVGFLARSCYFLGYITREEAMAYLNEVAKKSKETFSDWKEYVVSFCVGRSVAFSSNGVGNLAGFAYMLMKGSKYVLNKYPLSSL